MSAITPLGLNVVQGLSGIDLSPQSQPGLARAVPRDYAGEQAAAKNAANQRTAGIHATGGSTTILTGGGLGDYSLAPTSHRTLLGA